MSATAAAPSSSATTGTFASLIKPGAELGLMYAEALMKGIAPETFSHMPSKGAGRDINSPAFNLAHLSIYPDQRIFALLGRDDLVRPLPYSADLFKAGAPCVDEPGLYPAMDVIVKTFFERYRSLLEVLPSVPDAAFVRANPIEGRMRELFPTIGSAINFLMIGHIQSHLGQISVWRRVMGLGSAF